MKLQNISRRDFLKITSAGALSLALSELGVARALSAPPASYGRVIWSGVPLYDAPSFNAKELTKLNIDISLPIQAVLEGDEGYGNPFNKTWYQMDGGYAYSGWIQPVEMNYQKPVYEVHAQGQLGEVCAPFSVTRLKPSVRAKNGYRIYYGSVHWVKRATVNREEKSVWYEIYDSQTKTLYYVPSYDMRLVADEELAPLSPQIPPAEKFIHVDLAAQLVTAFEGQNLVFSARCSSGGKGTRTPTGEFFTYHKGPSVHMTNQDEEGATNYYSLPGVPWVSFFTGDGAAFHGVYWHNDYGRPRSHGCVNLRSEDAKWMYRWTSPVVPLGEDYLHLPGQGTRVQIV